MMRVCSSLLLSSLLLSATSVKAQNLETRSSLFCEGGSVSEISTNIPENLTFHSDGDRDRLPERGSGR